MVDIIDPLIPPYRFERVQPGLYRGGYPKPRNHRFLRRQRLKTIVSLIPGDNDSSLTAFCSAEHIDRIIINVQSPNENVTVTEETVSKCLKLATDPDRAPMYIHCLDGSNVTGMVIMCLRKLQLWRVASYQNEYLRFEQNGEIIPEESEFVETYTGRSLCLPNPYVNWLWPGRKTGPESDDAVNRLPFKGGLHPVVPFVGLCHRSPKPTAIDFPDALPTLSRSATGPAMLDSLDENTLGGSGSMETQAFKPSTALKSFRVMIRDTAGDIDGVAIDAAATAIARERIGGTSAKRVKDAGEIAQRTEQPLHMHMSQSTGALHSAGTESGTSAISKHTAPSISKPSSTEHLPALVSGGGGSDDPRVRRILDPILAALAANPTAPLASLVSPPAIAEPKDNGARGDSSVGRTQLAYHNRTPGNEAVATSGNDSSVACVAGIASILTDSTSSMAIGTMSAESRIPGELRENSTIIKEIALSRLVQALAIEGLGM
ncbi:protein-tyrosine-phosphatase [Coemansia sp. RSA 1813]|nr:protein-tyrosine-phosphatase [Coemansia sp. RSA 1843]KAJ2214125.1 protein-tyrosine-phosphatase [Coemansia sp. RSA 487]KAJ2569183.1 protein-tyrosine-phosphatase [Coemansia sp. RSA 1813]